MSYNSDGNRDKMTGQFAVPFTFPFSMVAWGKKDATGWAKLGDEKLLMLNNDTVSLDDGFAIINRGAPDELSAASWNFSGARQQASESHPDGTYDDIWVVMVATYLNDSERIIYVEDAANTSLDTDNAVTSALVEFIAIGGATQSDFQQWSGLLAEIALFNIVLNTTQVDALQTGSGAGPQPNSIAPNQCIGYWPLIEDKAFHQDESGNGGPTLTVEDSMPFSSDHPTIALTLDLHLPIYSKSNLTYLRR